MSTDVRVRVRLGTLRLEYEGERAFYESHVEKMVEAAARRDLTATNGAAPARAATPHPSPVASPAASVAAPSAAPAAPAGASPAVNGTSTRFAPSSEFGKFIRKLGPEAAEPDRQVVALAFYLWNYEKRATFGLDELEGCFRALSMPAPAAVGEILEDLTERKRFLEPAGDEWRLSRKGENYVKTRLLAGA
jgi:hypothetical protein